MQTVNEATGTPSKPISRQVARANKRRQEKAVKRHRNETILGKNRKRGGPRPG